MTPVDSLAPVMMTLAGIAYGKPSAIPGYLAADTLTSGVWSVVWSPTQPADGSAPANFAYIARNAETGAHVLAIRGTYPDPFSSAYWDDANEDSPYGEMQPWPGASDPNAKVSAGTWKAFGNLVALKDGDTGLQAAIAAIPADAPVYVTGHSLGGTLAPVMALWMTDLPTPRVPKVYAFAGMTPGNKGFAAQFGPRTPLAGKVWRYDNTLDTVGYGWDRVRDTRNFYQPAPRCGLLVEGLIDLMALRLKSYGYTGFGTIVPLPGKLSDTGIPCEFIAYLVENLHQHMPDTYLELLGAPKLPFSIGFGTVVTEGGSSAPRNLLTLPVSYR